MTKPYIVTVTLIDRHTGEIKIEAIDLNAHDDQRARLDAEEQALRANPGYKAMAVTLA